MKENKKRDGLVTHFEFEKWPISEADSRIEFINSIPDNIDYFMTYPNLSGNRAILL